MGIISVQASTTGQAGQLPKFVYIGTDDTVATVTTTGYLNKLIAQNILLSEYDMALVSTKTSPNSTSVQVNLYDVTKSGDNWSLMSPSAGAILPTVDGDVAIFANTTGTIEDSGIAASEISLFTGATVVGNLPKFDNITGKIEDSGIVASSVVTQTGGSVANNLPKYNSTTGGITDSLIPFTDVARLEENLTADTVVVAAADGKITNGNYAFIHGQTPSATIGGTTATIAAPGVTPSCLVWASFASRSINVAITKATAGVAEIAYEFSFDPGTNVIISYLALKPL